MRKLVDIEAQIAELQEEKKAIIEETKANAIRQIKEIMKEAGVNIKDLSSKRKIPAAKTPNALYKDGKNSWKSGARGRKPKWIQDYIDKGVDIEKFRVKQ